MLIKWRVVDTEYDVDGSNGSETAKLLVAENILTANVPYYETSNNHRNGTYANNYMDSQIRAYLNGISYQGQSAVQSQWNNNVFLQTAFTSEAIDKIITTKVDNAKEQMSYDGTYEMKEEYACAPTDDKIFLISEKEVVKYSQEAYNAGGKGNSRIRVTTDFAKANYAYQSTTDDYGGYWWLRSPYYDGSNYARSVLSDGNAYDSNYVDGSNGGVVPALSIKLQ